MPPTLIAAPQNPSEKLHAAIKQALATDTTYLAAPDGSATNAAYLALATPTTVQAVAQVKVLTQENQALTAQVQALTRQVGNLIRLAAGVLDGSVS